MNLLESKRIINWSSVSFVHDGIAPSLPVGCHVSMRCDGDLSVMAKSYSFHSPGTSNDGQSIYLPGGP